ncbi:MAG: transcription elongation factor subunit Spt4 [Candidatus Heimdallarchaeaceae archaeon]
MPKACRVCHLIVDTNTNTCPNCRVQDLSSEYMGEVFILNVEESEIAKRMNITSPGRYALRVR